MKPWEIARGRINCMHVISVLQEYLDGTLDHDQAKQIALHIEDCRRCGLEASVFTQIKSVLQGFDAPAERETLEHLRQFGERLVYQSEPKND